MEATTIRIITAVIKIALGENSSELILPQSRLGSREKGWRLEPRQALSATPYFPGRKAQAIGQRHKFLPIACIVFTTQAFSGLPLTARWSTPACAPFTEAEALSWHLTAGAMRRARVNSYNSSADAQELAQRLQLAGTHLFYWSDVHIVSRWIMRAVAWDLGCL